MKILVCVKQIPDLESPLEISQQNLWIQETDKLSFRMNRYDEYALEEAVLIKEAFKEVIVDVISVGPERVKSTIKKGLEKGADNGIHIPLNTTQYVSPITIATLISNYVKINQYNLIITGIMAEDDMQSQVGPLLAAKLSIPCASSVIKEKIMPDENLIMVESEIEGGVHVQAKITIPCLLTIQSGINRPRYPSLSNVLRAKSQEIIEFIPNSLSSMQNKEEVTSFSYPEKPTKGKVLQGTMDEKAEELLKILHEKSLL